jgi:phage tail sheath protein FI
MALNSNLTDISTIVAGVGTSKTIKNVISLNQIFSDTEAENLKTNNINPIRQYSGIGVFLMGNKTYKNNSSLITNRLNVMVTLNYIKRNVKTILQEYLFGPNNAIIRETISNRITNFLKDLYIFSSVGGGTFTVICNDANNTSATISAGSLVVDINLVLPPSTETITLNVVNTEDGSTVYTVNLV